MYNTDMHFRNCIWLLDFIGQLNGFSSVEWLHHHYCSLNARGITHFIVQAKKWISTSEVKGESTGDADNTWNFTITGTARLSQLRNSHRNSGVCGFQPVPYAEIRPSCPLNLMNFDNVYDIISRRWKKNIFVNVTLNIWRFIALSSWKPKL